MKVRKTEPLDDKAEGTCDGVPYATELVNCDGVSIHFWFGDETPSEDRLARLLSLARNYRDIVCARWSHGQPSSFWAHQNIPEAA